MTYYCNCSKQTAAELRYKTNTNILKELWNALLTYILFYSILWQWLCRYTDYDLVVSIKEKIQWVVSVFKWICEHTTTTICTTRPMWKLYISNYLSTEKWEKSQILSTTTQSSIQMKIMHRPDVKLPLFSKLQRLSARIQVKHYPGGQESVWRNCVSPKSLHITR